MRNPCLEIALRELEAVGIRDVERVRGGKHWQLRWQVNEHGLRIYTLPGTPSDWRSSHNVRAEIRRMLREDGLLAAPERPEEPTLAPTPKLDRLAQLERRMTMLEDLVRTIQTGGRQGYDGQPQGEAEQRMFSEKPSR
jgi:hypothetical protein